MKRLARVAFAAGLAVGISAAAAPRPAQAHATFVVNNRDPAGVGFNDPTPALPVGGNSGTTLGAQRLIAFQFAADTWGQALDSVIPIVIDANFGPLTCGSSLVTLGHAQPASAVASVPPTNTIPGLPSNLFYPQALAERISERDLALNPGDADILATFNSDLKGCDPSLDWYYGLDGNAGSLSDLIEVILHELAHGLGFQSMVDVQTNPGALLDGIMDVFSSHLYDDQVGRAWPAMSDAERAASLQNVRHLVWDGPNVMKMTPMVLAKGAPLLVTQPALAGLSGNLAEMNFGPLVADRPASGPLAVGNPLAGCSALASAPGAIVLLAGGSRCSPLNQALNAFQAGAAAVLLTDGNQFAPPSSVELPPSDLQQVSIAIPVVGITAADGRLLIADAGNPPTIALSGQSARLVGADEAGRPYLYASVPLRPGSTASHWDPLARPDLLEEPESGYLHPHDLRMELAALRDIGWAPFCGNGRIDPGEACDDGAANSDTAANACRATCVHASCGDGVVDNGEACDQGALNGGAGATCTATCTLGAGATRGGSGSGCGCAFAAGAAAAGSAAANRSLPLVVVLLLAGAAAGLGSRRARRRGRGRDRQNSRIVPSSGMSSSPSPSDSEMGSATSTL